MEEKTFVPIKVKLSAKTKMWYMDITDANLSELIELREKLNGINEDAICVLDGVIYEKSGLYDSVTKLNRRENDRIREQKTKRKQLIKTLYKKR